MSTVDDLKSILNSPKGKICTLLQTYIDKHPNAIPPDQLKSINSSLLKKLYEACQFTIRKNNINHVFVLVQIIRNIVEKPDLRIKLVDITELRDFICIILYQYLHNIITKSKKRKLIAEKALIIWASSISYLSKHLSIVQSVSENIYLMIDLLLNHNLSLDLKRELSECIVHLSKHASQKLQTFFLENSGWRSTLQNIWNTIPNLGDITSQMFFMTFFIAFVKAKKLGYSDFEHSFTSTKVELKFMDVLTAPLTLIRKAIFDCVLSMNEVIPNPTVFSFEIEKMKFGTYEPEYLQPHIHFGSDSLQFEISYPKENEPSLVEIYYTNIKKISIHTTTSPRISIVLNSNDIVEIDEFFNIDDENMNSITFWMKDIKSLKMLKKIINPLIKKSDLEKESISEQSEQSASIDEQETSELPELPETTIPTKKFSSTPKVAVPKRQVFSERRQILGDVSENVPINSKKFRSDQYFGKENESPIRRLNLSDEISEKDLEDWDNIAPVKNSYAASPLSIEMEEEVDSDFGDLNCKPVSQISTPEVSRKRKRIPTSQSLDDNDQNIHTLLEQIQEEIDRKKNKRRKVEESLCIQTQQTIDQKIEEFRTSIQSKRKEIEQDYKDRMTEYRNQITSITSDLRTNYSKFQTLLKSKSKQLSSVCEKIKQSKEKYGGKVSKFEDQSIRDIKKLEEDIKMILEQYENQIEDMRVVGDSTLKDFLKSFISTFQLQ